MTLLDLSVYESVVICQVLSILSTEIADRWITYVRISMTIKLY